MKLLKKNQVIILVIMVMFITIGYLSYENTETTESVTNISFGDAALVSTVGLVENDDENSETENEEVNAAREEETEETAVELVEEQKPIDDYFISSKLQRDAMYSQMLEAYQRILDNKDMPVDQKTSASEEIGKINTIRNAIMISENLIKNKNVDDVVIFVNDESINVIIKAEEPTSDTIAQVQNIIAREMNVKIEDIHIANR